MRANQRDESTRHPDTVLVVDTDAVFLEFEARAMTDRGYYVLKASETEEARRLSGQSANIDLLLHGSPIHKPNTLEFTQLFRRAHPSAPVLLALWSLEGFDQRVLLALWSLEGFDQRFSNLGHIRVMAKPFELIELINNVHRLLAEVQQPTLDSHMEQTISQAVSPIRGRVAGDEVNLTNSRATGPLACNGHRPSKPMSTAVRKKQTRK